jgi:hypothetical protein
MSNLAKQTASTLFALIGLCLLIVNTFGGLVAGIWLLAMGEWRLVVLGFLLSFIMPTAWSIASIPMLGFAALLFTRSEQPNRPAVAAGGFVLSIWNAALISMWCASVFFLFTGKIEEGTTLPLLLWAYSTTMAPLAYMASKEPPDSHGTALGMFLALVLYVVLLVTYLFDVARPVTMGIVISVALSEALVATSLGVAMTPPSRTNR